MTDNVVAFPSTRAARPASPTLAPTGADVVRLDGTPFTAAASDVTDPATAWTFDPWGLLLAQDVASPAFVA